MGSKNIVTYFNKLKKYGKREYQRFNRTIKLYKENIINGKMI